MQLITTINALNIKIPIVISSRKAEDTPGSAAPPAKKKAAKTPVPPSTPAVKHETPQTPAQETPAAAPPAPTSRSGRVIKAKKFADDLEPQAAPTPLKVRPRGEE